MQKFRFTFGSNQHLGGHYCQPIIAPSEWVARLLMFAKYDKTWAFQYSEEEWAKSFNGSKSYPTPMDLEAIVYDKDTFEDVIAGTMSQELYNKYGIGDDSDA